MTQVVKVLAIVHVARSPQESTLPTLLVIFILALVTVRLSLHITLPHALTVSQAIFKLSLVKTSVLPKVFSIPFIIFK